MKQLASIRNLFIILMTGLIFTSCQKDLPAAEEALPVTSATAATNAPTLSSRAITRTECFAAIARVAHCNEGRDILFGGTLEITENTTVSGNGTTQITRHFRARNLTGRSILTGGTAVRGTSANNCNDKTATPATVLAGTFKSYTVVGGAEMFSIHYEPGQSPTPTSASIYIHQGTLVFVNDTDNTDRIVVRHTIINTPGGQFINKWDCGGQ